MRKICVLLCGLLLLAGTQCKSPVNPKDKTKSMSSIKKETIDKTIKSLIAKYGEANKEMITKGVTQAASLWTEKDGKKEAFEQFCLDNYAGTAAEKTALMEKLSANFEVLFGNFNKISLDLKRALHIDKGEIVPVDEMFGAYEPSAHFNDDFFANKIAFITILNFPFYTLKEKSELGEKWTREQWVYARLGDMFIGRVPADVQQNVADALTASDTYISGYNIYMGNLVDEKGTTFWPKNLKLISHWGLRDELKSNYTATGLEKQKMIYEVMKRIILQEIPDTVINDSNVKWNPYANKVFTMANKEIPAKAEPDTRYKFLLENFNAMKSLDAYSPQYPTYQQRKFEQEMEIPMEQVEKIFEEFCSSPQVKKVGELISKRLNRKLEPFDIWYDGFKPRSIIPQEELDKKVKAKYADIAALQKDLPNILVTLGWKKDKAEYITSKIIVDPSRGAGHAWGAMMKGDNAHLRTRVPQGGMNYKGYNIACHEFGHTVEQTLSLYDVDHYMLAGVPNTAFTEALAFIFQKRDLELLGIKNTDPDKEYYMTLDEFWACYEIMGVSLVDIGVWKWMYKHPDAKPKELREAVISIAKDVWNKYYAPVFGQKDQPVLAIYSHMIDSPLYLSAYPVGHLIQFQLEKQMKDKNMSDEITRIFTYGRVIPQLWMKHAVGGELSAKPMLEATDNALRNLQK